MQTSLSQYPGSIDSSSGQMPQNNFGPTGKNYSKNDILYTRQNRTPNRPSQSVNLGTNQQVPFQFSNLRGDLGQSKLETSAYDVNSEKKQPTLQHFNSFSIDNIRVQPIKPGINLADPFQSTHKPHFFQSFAQSDPVSNLAEKSPSR